VTLYVGEIENDASGQRALYSVNGCSGMKSCGVQTQSGNWQSFNWERCPYVTAAMLANVYFIFIELIDEPEIDFSDFRGWFHYARFCRSFGL
jgi:hypothetical protein